jgi:hypothetical protein
MPSSRDGSGESIPEWAVYGCNQQEKTIMLKWLDKILGRNNEEGSLKSITFDPVELIQFRVDRRVLTGDPEVTVYVPQYRTRVFYESNTRLKVAEGGYFRRAVLTSQPPENKWTPWQDFQATDDCGCPLHFSLTAYSATRTVKTENCKNVVQALRPIRIIETEGSMGMDKNTWVGNILRNETRKVYCGSGDGVEEEFYVVRTLGGMKEMWVAVSATTRAEDGVIEYRY